MLKRAVAASAALALKKAGVDLTRPDAIEAALGKFDRGVTELAKLMGIEL
ncbi:MAG: hypothetical protein IPH09_16525 [bacterium]|nr:hypothetical protein [bacterium]